jgi:DNA-directed RNA polymerase I subunit RPA43
MHDALGGAKELLDGMLMRHHHQLGGVLVSYADARVVGTDARIIHQAGHCDVHVRCTARVFCPEPGRKLVGTVNKVGADFVGLLVMGVFNASVASADISDEFIHNPIDASPGGCWESAEDNGEHRIAVGSDVVFVVKAVSEHDDVLHMLGSLKETNTGEATRVLGAGYAVETIGNGDGNGDAYGDVGTETSPEANDLTSVEGDAATPKKKGKGKNGTSSAEKKAKSSEKKAKKEKKEKKEKSAKKEKKEKRKRED